MIQNLKNQFDNMSAEHVDIISTANRKVVATLQNGEEKVIYENGKFTI